VYDYDFSSSTTGTHLVVFETTDANADAQVFAEDIIVSTGGGGGSLTAAQVWTYTTRTLTSAGLVTVVSNVDQDARLTAIIGDAYNAARDNLFEWTSASFADRPIDTATSITFRMRQGGTLHSYAVVAATATRLTMTLDSDDTAAWLPGVYDYQIAAAWDSDPGNEVTLVNSEITILPRVQ
jgi:hypothetical protein